MFLQYCHVMLIVSMFLQTIAGYCTSKMGKLGLFVMLANASVSLIQAYLAIR